MSKAAKPPTLELWAIERLIPDVANAKKHPKDEISRLANVIKRFGWDQPIVVESDGRIIKGHGRRLAAIELGLKEVPVWVRADLTREEAAAARIADNAVIGTSFDTRILQEELRRLLQSEEEMLRSFTAEDMGLSEKDQQLFLQEIELSNPLALIGDTAAEVESHKTADEERVAGADSEIVPVSKALGFKTVTREQERRLVRAMAQIEEIYPGESIEALLTALEAAVA